MNYRLLISFMLIGFSAGCGSVSESGPENGAPDIVTQTLPTDGASNVSLRPTFTWTSASDPEADPVTYSVYFGPSSKYDSMYSYGESRLLIGTSYQPTFLLEPGSKYYWYVQSEDDYNSIASEILTFTTTAGTIVEDLDFETQTIPNADWETGDLDPNSGEDYWDDLSKSSGARVSSGDWSLYCAGTADVTELKYDNDMYAYFESVNGFDYTGKERLVVSYKIWYETEPDYDFASFQYWNGLAWVELDRLDSTSNGWERYQWWFSGGSVVYVRWVFESDGSTTMEGAYVDDIRANSIDTGFSKAEGEIIVPTSVSAPPKGLRSFIPKRPILKKK